MYPYQFRYLFLALSAVFGFATTAIASNNLPDIGDATDAVLSIDEENKIGKEFMRSVRASLPLVNDPVSNEYIQALGERLASQIDSRDRIYTFFIVKDPTINAFAGPGGYIGVHTGLILSAESEDEFASVVAHEIAHVSQRHLVRAFKANSNMTLPAMAAIIAAILLGQGNSEITEAVIASTLAGTTQQQLSFSRIHEQEADRVGIDMLAKAGYDPLAMPKFFETMQKSQRYTNVYPEFLLTHPVTISRVADTRGRAEQYPKVDRPPSRSLTYELIRARLYYITHNKTLRQNQLISSTPPLSSSNPYAQSYQKVLELQSKEQYDEARKHIEQLINDDTARIPYIISQAEIELDENRFDKAAQILKDGLSLYPNNTPMTLLYTSTLIDNKQPQQAMSLLEERVRNGNVHLDYFRLYAEAAQLAGRKSEAYESLGEYYYRLGSFHTAIKQFQRALKENNNDKIRALKLEARINEIKQEVLNNQPEEAEESDKQGLAA